MHILTEKWAEQQGPLFPSLRKESEALGIFHGFQLSNLAGQMSRSVLVRSHGHG